MARDEAAGSLADANGSMEGASGAEPLTNGSLENGGGKKLTVAEREKEKRRRAALRKKQKKASKQAERCALACCRLALVLTPSKELHWHAWLG